VPSYGGAGGPKLPFIIEVYNVLFNPADFLRILFLEPCYYGASVELYWFLSASSPF
jgi:hypothetical protein